MSALPIRMSLQSIDYTISQIEELAKNPGVSDSILFFLDRMEDLFPGLGIIKKRTYINIYLPSTIAAVFGNANDKIELALKQKQVSALTTATDAGSSGGNSDDINNRNNLELLVKESIIKKAIPDAIVTAILDRDKPTCLVYLNTKTFSSFTDGFKASLFDYPFFGDDFVVISAESRDFMSRLALRLAGLNKQEDKDSELVNDR